MTLFNRRAPLDLLIRQQGPICQPANGRLSLRVAIRLLALTGIAVLILGPLNASAQADGPQAVPDVPNKPTATAVYEGMVDLEWNEVPGATSYDVQAFYSDWFDLPGNGVELAFYGPGAIIKGLIPGSRYYFRVRANNSLGSSEWSKHLLVNPTGGDFGNWDDVPEPTNSTATGAPTISGTAQVGKTLTADISGIKDENGLDRVKFHYQWVSSDGTDEEDIEGGTDASYVLVAADEGRFIKVWVSFTDRGGYAESVPSAATEAVVVPPNIDATGAPTISGKPLVQETLTASTSDIQDENGLDRATFSYQWIWNDGTSDKDDIQGATDSAYTLSDADEGKTISVRVSFTDRDGYRETLTSAATVVVVVPPNIDATGAPTISGKPLVQETLTASTSDIQDENGLDGVKFSYQWIWNDGTSDKDDIQGATDSTYTLSDADEGKTISVRVSFTDRDGYRETLTSAPTNKVASPPGPPLNLGVSNDENGELALSWEAPASDGGSAIREYKAQWKSGNEEYDPSREALVNGLSYTVRSLTNGVEYTVQVAAVNGVGEGEAAEVTATPRDTAPPELLTAQVYGSTVTLTFNEALDANSKPHKTTFSVLVAGTARGVGEVTVSGSSVSLTLGSAVSPDASVTLSYSAPQDTGERRLQDTAGNDALSFRDEPVVNDTPAPSSGVICGRTEQVRDKILLTVLKANSGNILWELPADSDCASVSESDLFSITSLRLWYEDITELQPGDFQGLSNLAYLGLSNNDLTELPAGVFSGLSNLEELDLSGNDLTELPAGVFSGLSNLEELDLSGNDLTELPAGVFSGLSNLEELHLRFNELTELPAGVFSDLDSLKELDLARNDLRELPAGVFSGLSNLEELDLRFNELTELPISIFSGLDNLKRLYLERNPGVPFWCDCEELEDHNGIKYTDQHGDTPETATPLPYGSSSKTSKIYPGTDVDYFELEVTEDNQGYIGVFVTSRSDITGLYYYHSYALFDSEGKCARPRCDYLGGVFNGGRYSLEPGTYYLRVVSEPHNYFPDAMETNTSYSVIWTIDYEYREFIDRCSAIETDFDDPLYGCQSMLDGRGDDAADINVEPVWAEGNLGEGIVVRIVDRGVDFEHEDLRDNFDMARSVARSDGLIFSPMFLHGTAVAGVLAARDNTVGGRGVAPRATIYSHYSGSWDDQTRAATHELLDTAVSNHSTGLRSAGKSSEYPALIGSDWESAIEKGIQQGFHGKGTSFVFGVGNDGLNANLSEVANFYGVINVCGIRSDGSPYYSYGSHVWICAPYGLLTTSAYDHYHEGTQGTSYATPVVSGVVALVRNENRSLTWRDVKLILAASARQVNPDAPEWETGALRYGSTDYRYTYHPRFAFGVVDAKAAVDLAKTWTNLPPMETNSAESGVLELTVPDPAEGAEPTTVSHSLTLGPETGFIEFVEVSIEFDHPSLRDLGVEIVSPSGTVSMLTEPNEAVRDAEFRDTFRFGSAKHLGEDPTGTWTLRLTDHVPGQEGSIKGWSLKVYGHGAGTVQTAIPTIIGTVQVGQTLTADTSGIADGDGLTNVVFSYQWIRNDGTNDEDIDGANGATYTLVKADEGMTVKVTVSFTDAGGNPETLTSDPTGEVAAKPNTQATGQPNTQATGQPTISGTVRVGETLTAETSGIADADGLTNVVFAYQWMADDTAIQDATGSSYTLTGDDAGKAITVTVSFTDDANNVETLTSEPTGPVVPDPGPLTVFKVVDTSSNPDTVLGTLEDGGALKLANPASGSYGIRVDTDSGHDDHDDIHKVELALSGAKTEGKEEWVPPYSLYGDEGEGNLKGENLPAGAYELKATAYDDDGDALGTLKVSFTVTAGQPAQQPTVVPNTSATGVPTISGTAQVGETLTAETSGIADADGLTNVVFAYQWMADDTAIQDATGSSYTLTGDDAGKAITVTVSFTDDANNVETLTSDPTGEVAAKPNTSATGAPTISGTAQVGQTLTASTAGIVDADGLTTVSYSYQWVADDEDIAGATGSSYTLTGDDEGKAITVTVSFTDAEGNPETLTSAPTGEVEAKPNTSATGVPTIDGTAQVGQTLTADTSGIDDEDGLTQVVFSYQWIRNDGNADEDIAGATGSSYTLTGDDEGKTIRVAVSFTDDAEGNPETLTSDPTAEVESQAGPLTGFTVVDAADTDQAVLWKQQTNGSKPEEGDTWKEWTDGGTLALGDPENGRYGIRAEIESGEGIHRVALELTLESTGEQRIDRTDDAAPYSLYGDEGEDALHGENLPVGSYTLKATAYTGDGEILGSLEISFTVALAKPSKPQDLEGEASAQRIELAWKAPSGSVVVEYVVYRGTLRNGSMNGQALSKYATVDAAGKAMTYTDDNVEEGVEYRYRVAAVNSAGEGKKSTWLDITAK